jgi:hypothetical protein
MKITAITDARGKDHEDVFPETVSEKDAAGLPQRLRPHLPRSHLSEPSARRQESDKRSDDDTRTAPGLLHRSGSLVVDPFK